MTLDGLAREGARRMLMSALEEEVSDYAARNAHERNEDGHALVVRNGRARGRKVTMGCGTVEVEAPRVNDQREVEGERPRFTSHILPPYMRRSPKVSEVLPLLYLRGLSTNDFVPALKDLLGEDASGLSSTAITRLTAKWQSEYDEFRKRDLSKEDYAYIWVDGVHFNVRLEDDRLCTLVVLGVRADGTKELLAVEDGYRESEESWSSVLRGLGRRGMKAPLLSIGDGALGFWAAVPVRNVWPETRHELCWVHKLNILDKLPKRLHGRAKLALKEIWKAETKEQAEEAVEVFESDFGAKYPKAVASLTEHRNELLLRSTIFLPSTGSTFEPRIPSSRPSPPFVFDNESPRAQALVRKRFSWPTSYSTWRVSAGTASTRRGLLALTSKRGFLTPVVGSVGNSIISRPKGRDSAMSRCGA